MKILFIGDIVASPGRDAVKKILPELKKEQNIDFVIANAENLAHGRGATTETIREMQDAGVNYFTGGDHLFWHRGFEDEVDDLPIVRPANYPAGTPGKGYALLEPKEQQSILLINLMGRTSFGSTTSLLEDPFRKADEILEEHRGISPLITLVDFHAEATSEKQALALYLDGRVTAVLGTHTHVPTCDDRLLPEGTMYVTDIGMTGNIDSVLGVKKEIIISLFLTAQNQKFEWENAGKTAFRSVILDTGNKTIVRFDKEV
jgi:2',3'-cyclic-nucleotide 2'-phosphodiesterase